MVFAIATAAENIDTIVLALGGVLLCAFAARVSRRPGGWAATLRLSEPRSGPDVPVLIGALAGMMVAYVLPLAITQAIFGAASFSAPQAEVDFSPGRQGWHVLIASDMAVKTAIGAICCVFAARLYRLRQMPASLGEKSVLALVSTPAVLAACVVVLWVCEPAYHAVYPELPQAVHPILVAWKETQWGTIGRVQMFVSAVVVAPFAEEAIFRGILLPATARLLNSPWGAIAATGVMFGMTHLSIPPSVPPLILFGLFVGFLRLKTGSLWTCVLLHALFNLRTMLLALAAPEKIGMG